MLKPPELIAAVLSGWAAAAAVHTIGPGGIPGIVVGLLEVAAAVAAGRIAAGVTRTVGSAGISPERMTRLEVLAAVATGCAAAWAGHAVGFEAVPTVLVGLLAGATVRGTYRRLRYAR